MGWVREVVLENFKSYEGTCRIGPFERLSSIVGPNGAGKSNLMEAISFVLGVEATHLRAKDLKLLIHRKERETVESINRPASVSLTFLRGPESEESIVFRRSIAPSGEASYFLNEKRVEEAEYQQALESVDILWYARNFLVFQGDVDNMAKRQGMELTHFFERLSGSESLKAEYDALAKEKTRLEESARQLFAERRTCLAMEKLMELGQKEAAEYLKLDKDLLQLRIEQFLLRLFAIEEKAKETTLGLAQEQITQNALKSEFAELKEAFQGSEQRRAQAKLDLNKAQKALEEVQREQEPLREAAVLAKGTAEHLNERLADLQQQGDKVKERREKKQARIAVLEAEQSELVKQRADLDSKRASQQHLHLTAQQKKQYDAAEQEAHKVSAGKGERLFELERETRLKAKEKHRVQQDLRETVAKHEHMLHQVEVLDGNEEAQKDAVDRTLKAMKQKEMSHQRLQASMGGVSQDKEKLMLERHALIAEIQDKQATQQQVDRERRMQNVTADLKSMIPGVFGRVGELCWPCEKRFHVAVNVALGGYFDAIVVESSQVGRRCVQFLKERQLPQMIFLPVADLKVSMPSAEVVQAVRSSQDLWMGTDVVVFKDEKIRQCFDFMLGCVVIAKNMQVARKLAFGNLAGQAFHGEVVSLVGEKISGSGNLSVNTEAARAGATRFDLSELSAAQTAAQSRLQALDKKLYSLHHQESSSSADQATALDELRQSQARHAEAKAKLAQIDAEVKQRRYELEEAEKDTSLFEAKVQQVVEEENRLQEEQKCLEDEVGRAVTVHFEALSRALGVPDVRKIVEENKRCQVQFRSQEKDLSLRMGNIDDELKMLREEQEREDALSYGDEAKVSEDLAAQELIVKERQGAAEQVAEKVNELQSTTESLKAQERAEDEAMANLRRECQEKRQDIHLADKRHALLKAEMTRLEVSRTDTLTQSTVEDIEVPKPEGQEDKIDFSSLNDEKRRLPLEVAEENNRLARAEISAKLDELNPNHKASRHLASAADRTRNASREAEQARIAIRDAQQRFDAVRQTRTQRFMNCFQRVQESLDGMYKQLTAHGKSEGGSAFMDLDNQEVPFDSGIRFTVMPPGQRLRDMHHLSGGERTLASMALLFAVQNYSKPPFMILDEVDANLDEDNTRCLWNFVERSDCQMLVISLKAKLVARSKALIGVYKDRAHERTVVRTLDLSPWHKNQSQLVPTH